jgi:hypothetical protein
MTNREKVHLFRYFRRKHKANPLSLRERARVRG